MRKGEFGRERQFKDERSQKNSGTKGKDEGPIEDMIIELKKIADPSKSAEFLLSKLRLLSSQSQSITKLIKFAVSSKLKYTLEELSDPYTVEGLVAIAMDLIGRRAESNWSLVLKFIWLQNLAILKNKSVIKRLVEYSLNSLGGFVNQDKSILAIFLKLSYQNPDDLRFHRMAIVDKLLSVFFLYFSLLMNSKQRQDSELIRNYSDLLKLFLFYGKELIDIRPVEEKQKYVPEDAYSYIAVFLEVCKLSMFLGITSHADQVFSESNKTITKLLKNKLLTDRIHSASFYSGGGEEDKERVPNIISSENTSSCYSTSESQSDKYKLKEDDVNEKVRINAAKNISMLLKLFPKVFVDNQLWSVVIPSASINLSKLMGSDTDFVPKNIFQKGFLEAAKDNYLKIFVPLAEKKHMELFEFRGLRRLKKLMSASPKLKEEVQMNLQSLKSRAFGELRAKGRP